MVVPLTLTVRLERGFTLRDGNDDIVIANTRRIDGYRRNRLVWRRHIGAHRRRYCHRNHLTPNNYLLVVESVVL